MTTRYVLVTGDGEGLGNALVHALLRVNATVRVIGVSRRKVAAVEGYARLSDAQRVRYVHLQGDLSESEGQVLVARGARETIARAGGTLAAIALVNGTGYLDTEIERRPELDASMLALNVTAPLTLTEALEDLLEPTAPLLYYSGLLTHPSSSVPLLVRHAEVKKLAADALKARWPERTKLVMPGTYRTNMVLHSIVQQGAMLEWFTMPLSDPHACGGLSDAVAGYALGLAGNVPERVIFPRITRMLVEGNTARELQKSLPGAIRRAARGILDATGQTLEQHDRRVRFLEAQGLYGADFPYASILSDQLWPGWMSRAYAASLRLARMVD